MTPDENPIITLGLRVQTGGLMAQNVVRAIF
jgi:hypothetical protein